MGKQGKGNKQESVIITPPETPKTEIKQKQQQDKGEPTGEDDIILSYSPASEDETAPVTQNQHPKDNRTHEKTNLPTNVYTTTTNRPTTNGGTNNTQKDLPFQWQNFPINIKSTRQQGG